MCKRSCTEAHISDQSRGATGLTLARRKIPSPVPFAFGCHVLKQPVGGSSANGCEPYQAVVVPSTQSRGPCGQLPTPYSSSPPRPSRHLTSPPIRPQRHLRSLHHRVLHRGRPTGQLIRLRLHQLRRAHPRGLAGQQRNAFAHMPHGVDMEQPAFHRV